MTDFEKVIQQFTAQHYAVIIGCLIALLVTVLEKWWLRGRKIKELRAWIDGHVWVDSRPEPTAQFPIPPEAFSSFVEKKEFSEELEELLERFSRQVRQVSKETAELVKEAAPANDSSSNFWEEYQKESEARIKSMQEFLAYAQDNPNRFWQGKYEALNSNFEEYRRTTSRELMFLRSINNPDATEKLKDWIEENPDER